MNKQLEQYRQNRRPCRSWSQMLLLLGLLLLLPNTLLLAQQRRTPPNFTPPPLPQELQDNFRFAPGFNPDDTVNRIVFREEAVENVFRFLEDLTGKTVLQQESLPTPLLNFDSRGELTRAEAVQAIETILTLNGVSVTSLGDKFIKAVPTASIRYQSPDILLGSTLSIPPSQRHYSKVFDIKHLSLDEVTQIVNNLQTPGLSTQLVLKKANAIMVTDSLTNLQQIEKVLQKVDVPTKMDTQMIFRNLNYISADDLRVRLEAMALGPLKRFLDGDTFFESDERTNQIIILTNPANVDIIEEVITSLDVDAAPLTRTEVFYLKHAMSDEVAVLLNSLVSGQTSAARRTSSSSRVTTKRTQPQNDDATVSNSTSNGNNIDSGSNDQFSPYITIEPDERSNAIIAFGTSSDIRYISELIKKIDIELAQVRIDVIIAEVNVGDKYSRGIDSFGLNYDSDNEITVGLNQLVGSDNGFSDAISDLPIVIGATLEEFTLNTVFRTAESDSDVKILSAPTLMTTHNQEASISVGEKRPVISGTSTDSTGSSIRSEVNLEQIGIELKVKPLIGATGVVQLEITQVIDSVNGTTLIDGNEQPIIGNREASSFVTVADGEVVVLGGLQQEETRLVEGKMFLLGQIPLLGDWLFSSKRTENSRQDLVIFIRPQVIFSSEHASEITREMIERNHQRPKIDRYLDTLRFEAEEANGE